MPLACRLNTSFRHHDLPRNLDLDPWLLILVHHAEWEVFDILLYIPIVELAPNQSLDVENRPVWIRRELGSLLASPTNRSSSFHATHDGVMRLPWSLTRISTLPPFMMPTQE